MRHAMASTCLVLVLGLPSCSKSTVDSELRVPTTVSLEASESIGAVEFLETMSWPPGVAPIDLSSSAENQLRRMIFNDAEITAFVRDIAAVGLTIDGQPNGALMLIGVGDLVIGNITFVNGLEAAALSTFETARWGPMTGSLMRSDDQTWAVLPLTSVIAVAATTERLELDRVMNALVRRFTRQ